MISDPIHDRLGRSMRDLRISVTDRCNLRCRYCMPAEVFGPDYPFLPRREILSYEEIARLARICARLGTEKIRLTGGEPLLRRDLHKLVRMLAAIPGYRDLALTTNGRLLESAAQPLRAAGLARVTVSLDALDEAVLQRLNGFGSSLDDVKRGIRAAVDCGFEVKLNTVVVGGVNENQILPLAEYGLGQGIPVRFIEYMDTGMTNGWKPAEVFPAARILEMLGKLGKVVPLEPRYPGEVARRFRVEDRGEVGIIASVTAPFCRNCTRLRLSADGKLFGCLFSGNGFSIKRFLRDGSSDAAIVEAMTAFWQRREDRYSELREIERSRPGRTRPEMSYLGG